MDKLKVEIRELFKTNDPLRKADLVLILFQLVERIEILEAAHGIKE